jgi:hypothetical protein
MKQKFILLLSICIRKYMHKIAGTHGGISQKTMEVAFVSITLTVECMSNGPGRSRKAKNGSLHNF